MVLSAGSMGCSDAGRVRRTNLNSCIQGGGLGDNRDWDPKCGAKSHSGAGSRDGAYGGESFGLRNAVRS